MMRQNHGAALALELQNLFGDGLNRRHGCCYHQCISRPRPATGSTLPWRCFPCGTPPTAPVAFPRRGPTTPPPKHPPNPDSSQLVLNPRGFSPESTIPRNATTNVSAARRRLPEVHCHGVVFRAELRQQRL